MTGKKLAVLAVVFGCACILLATPAAAHDPPGMSASRTLVWPGEGEVLVHSLEGSFTVTEYGEVELPEELKGLEQDGKGDADPQDFFGGDTGRHGRILFNVKGGNTGLTFAVQVVDLYWVYEGATGCYSNIYSSQSCGTSNGWTNSRCTNYTTGGGYSAPTISVVGNYSKGSHSFTLTTVGHTSGGIRLFLHESSNVHTGSSLPEPLLISYAVFNWKLW